MELLQSVNEFWASFDLRYALGFLGLVLALVVLLCVSTSLRLNNLYKRYSILTRGTDRKSMEELLADCLRKLEETVAGNLALSQEVQSIRESTAGHIQHVGMVRYSAFSDIGSDLSFSAAFLDANFNGLVINSIFGRDESRTYAKPILGGASSYPLTEEEQAAVRNACASKTLSRRVNKKGIKMYE